MQEALTAANAEITDPSVELVANPGTALSRKLVDMSVDYDCGKFAMTQVDGAFNTCKGVHREGDLRVMPDGRLRPWIQT